MWGQSNVYFGGPNIPQLPHRSQPVSQSQNISQEISYNPFFAKCPGMTKFKISFGVMIFQFVTQVLSVLFIIIKIRDISLISAKLANHFFIYAYKQLAFSSLLKTLLQAPRSHRQDFQCPLLLGSSQSVFQSLS